jgi:Na+-transporting NADH:ubiquinone oxidoreductase subunit NqrD
MQFTQGFACLLFPAPSILGRAEGYANSNGVLASAFDAIGMGAGFTAALTLMAIVRETLGAGAFAGIHLFNTPVGILILPPGGFFIYGCMIALANRMQEAGGKKQENKCMDCMECAGRPQPMNPELSALIPDPLPLIPKNGGCAE